MAVTHNSLWVVVHRCVQYLCTCLSAEVRQLCLYHLELMFQLTHIWLLLHPVISCRWKYDMKPSEYPNALWYADVLVLQLLNGVQIFAPSSIVFHSDAVMQCHISY